VAVIDTVGGVLKIPPVRLTSIAGALTSFTVIFLDIVKVSPCAVVIVSITV